MAHTTKKAVVVQASSVSVQHTHADGASSPPSVHRRLVVDDNAALVGSDDRGLPRRTPLSDQLKVSSHASLRSSSAPCSDSYLEIETLATYLRLDLNFCAAPFSTRTERLLRRPYIVVLSSTTIQLSLAATTAACRVAPRCPINSKSRTSLRSSAAAAPCRVAPRCPLNSKAPSREPSSVASLVGGGRALPRRAATREPTRRRTTVHQRSHVHGSVPVVIVAFVNVFVWSVRPERD